MCVPETESETSRCNGISLSLTNEALAALWCWQLPMKECIIPIGSPVPPVTQLHVFLSLVACTHTQTHTHACICKKHIICHRVPILCSSSVFSHPPPTPRVGSLPLLLPLPDDPSSFPSSPPSYLRSTPRCVQVQGCWQTVSLGLRYLNTHSHTQTHTRSLVPTQALPSFPLCELVSTQQARSHSHCQHIKKD